MSSLLALSISRCPLDATTVSSTEFLLLLHAAADNSEKNHDSRPSFHPPSIYVGVDDIQLIVIEVLIQFAQAQPRNRISSHLKRFTVGRNATIRAIREEGGTVQLSNDYSRGVRPFAQIVLRQDLLNNINDCKPQPTTLLRTLSSSPVVWKPLERDLDARDSNHR